MRIKRTCSFHKAAIAVLIATSIACNSVSVPFLATSTPTNTLTPQPTPTSTVTPSPTPFSKSQVEKAALTLQDLPAGYEVIPGQPPSADNQVLYGYIDARRFHIVSGIVAPVIDDQDRLAFEALLGNPDLVIEAMSSNMPNSKFENFQTLADLKGYGDESTGFTAETSINGIKVRADFFIMKKFPLGTFITSIYRLGKQPPITIEEFASVLEGKLTAASE